MRYLIFVGGKAITAIDGVKKVVSGTSVLTFYGENEVILAEFLWSHIDGYQKE